MFIIETVLCVALCCAEIPRSKSDAITFFSTPVVRRTVVNDADALGYRTELRSGEVKGGQMDLAIAQDLASIAHVQHVLIDQADKTLSVWVIVDQHESDTRDRIYDKELAFMDAFPEFEFDFNLVPALDRPLNQIVSGMQLIYSKNA